MVLYTYKVKVPDLEFTKRVVNILNNNQIPLALFIGQGSIDFSMLLLNSS